VPGYADSGRRGPTVCTRHAVDTRNQCMSRRSGVTLSNLRFEKIRRAAAFKTDCNLSNVNRLTWQDQHQRDDQRQQDRSYKKSPHIARIWRKAAKQLDADFVTCVVMEISASR